MTIYLTLISQNPRMSYVINKNPNSPSKDVVTPTFRLEGRFLTDTQYLVTCKPSPVFGEYLSTQEYNHPNFGYSALSEYFKSLNLTEDKPYPTSLILSTKGNFKYWKLLQDTLPETFTITQDYFPSIVGNSIREVTEWYRLLTLLIGFDNDVPVNKDVLLRTIKYLNPPYPILKEIRYKVAYYKELEKAVTYNIKFDRCAALKNSLVKLITSKTNSEKPKYIVKGYPQLAKRLYSDEDAVNPVYVYTDYTINELDGCDPTEFFYYSKEAKTGSGAKYYVTYPVGDALDGIPEGYVIHWYRG